MFLGLVLLIIGLVIVLNAVFGLHIPFVRILIGFLFVYIGVKIMVGPSWCFRLGKNSDPLRGKIVFSEGQSSPHSLDDLNKHRFDVVFGEGKLDLTKTIIKDGDHLDISTVFGEARVYIPKNISLETQVSSVAGTTKLPDETKASGPHVKVLKVRINTVFGTTRIKRKDAISPEPGKDTPDNGKHEDENDE